MLTKQHLTALGFVFSMAFGLISGPVTATTPDGETPANEGICDSLQGGTGGLYGLCIAYCEAQDLDNFDKNPPSAKILANYNKKKQVGDPDMPCTSPNFGCFTQANLDAIVTTSNCMRFTDSNGSFIQYGTTTNFARVDTRPTPSCGYIDLSVSPIIVNNQTITDAQALAAYDAVKAKCDSQGL